MEAKASSPATLPIVESGAKTAYFALDLECEAKAALGGRGVEVSGAGKSSKSVKDAVSAVLRELGYKGGVRVKIMSSIPAGFGLGEEETMQVSAAFAAASSVAKKEGGIYELRIDKFMSEQFLIVRGRLFGRAEILDIIGKTGAFGRLSASAYGGFVVCDGAEIMRRGEMETLGAVLSLPKKPAKAGKDSFAFERKLAWEEALKGNLYTAMGVNALTGGDRGRIEDAAKKALAVSATAEGAVAGLYRGRQPKNAVLTQNKGVAILEKPKKIVKTEEFLKLKGKQKFTLL
jgi:shikimate kinase